MKAAVSHITAASGRRVVIVVNVAVEPGTAAETADALKGCKGFIDAGMTITLAEIVAAGRRLIEADAAAPAAAPTAPDDARPTSGAMVRHVLSDFATVAHRDLLASVVTVADTPQEWRGIAEDFAAASRAEHEHPDNARDLSFAHRAACAMADGDEQRAAQELAACDGIDLCSWVEATEEEMLEDGTTPTGGAS